MATYRTRTSINNLAPTLGWIQANERILGDHGNGSGPANRVPKMLSDNMDLLYSIAVLAGWNLTDSASGLANNHFLVVKDDSITSIALPTGVDGDEIRVLNAKPNKTQVSVTGTGLAARATKAPGDSVHYSEDVTFTKGASSWSSEYTDAKTIPTLAAGTSDNSPASTEFVANAVTAGTQDTSATLSALVDGAPANRNTLKELADAIAELENNMSIEKLHLAYVGEGGSNGNPHKEISSSGDPVVLETTITPHSVDSIFSISLTLLKNFVSTEVPNIRNTSSYRWKLEMEVGGDWYEAYSPSAHPNFSNVRWVGEMFGPQTQLINPYIYATPKTTSNVKFRIILDSSPSSGNYFRIIGMPDTPYRGSATARKLHILTDQFTTSGVWRGVTYNQSFNPVAIWIKETVIV